MLAYLAFEERAAVEASIVILAFKDVDRIFACLRSIRENVGDAVSYEVVVVANGCAQDVTTALETHVRGITLRTSRVNLGFAGGCMAGAAHARGDFLIFLNDDATVAPQWLESLVRTARRYERAGAVGSKVLFTDGRIQEAGGIVFSDGSSMGLGRGMPADASEHDFIRTVDYCSACSLLVKKATWDAVGGFTDDYFPAYYEDVDLALSIAKLGQAVLYDPNSRIYHAEYASTDERFRGFLFERNRRIFAGRWAQTLALRLPPVARDGLGVRARVRLAARSPRRVLIVDDRPPLRELGSGFGRMFDLVSELDDGRTATTLFPILPSADEGRDLGALGVHVVREPFDTFVSRSDVSFDVAIVSRPHNFAIVERTLRRFQPQASLVFDVESLFYRRLALQARYASTTAEAMSLLAESAQMRATETAIAERADRIVCISIDERDELEKMVPGAIIDLIRPEVRDVGIDDRGYDERAGIAFVSGWLAGPTAPNADGIVWFVRQVWPIVSSRVPHLRLSISGSNPPERVRALASESVEILGFVEDLRSLYAHSLATIAPLRYGAGVKIKTIESLQYGTPVVATDVGAEGLGLSRDSSAVLRAADARTFAELTVRLVTDRNYWGECRSAVVQQLARWHGAPSRTWSDVIDDELRAQPGRLRA